MSSILVGTTKKQINYKKSDFKKAAFFMWLFLKSFFLKLPKTTIYPPKTSILGLNILNLENKWAFFTHQKRSKTSKKVIFVISTGYYFITLGFNFEEKL